MEAQHFTPGAALESWSTREVMAGAAWLGHSTGCLSSLPPLKDTHLPERWRDLGPTLPCLAHAQLSCLHSGQRLGKVASVV